MGSVESFVLGVIITIVVAVLAPFSTGPIQRWWATRTKKQSLRTIEILEHDYAIVEEYHNEPLNLLRFLGMRILLLTLLWIGQSLLDVLIGFVINGFNVASLEFSYYTLYPINTNAVSDWGSAIGSLVDAVLLGILFRVGIRSYRIARNVANFEQYKIKISNEIAVIREKYSSADDAQEQRAGSADT
jgi:hypothetical protein